MSCTSCGHYPTPTNNKPTCSTCSKCSSCCTCGKQLIHQVIDCNGKHITQLTTIPALSDNDLFYVYDLSDRTSKKVTLEALAEYVCNSCGEDVVIPTLIEGTYGGANKYLEITVNSDGYITSILEGDDTILGNSDVQVGSPGDEQILVWDAATSKWIFQDLPTFTETTTVDAIGSCGVDLVDEPSPKQYKVARLSGSALIAINRDAGETAYISTVGGFFRQFTKSTAITGTDALGFTEVDILDEESYNEVTPACSSSADQSNKRLTQKRLWLKDSDFIIEEVADNIKVSVDFTAPLSALVNPLVSYERIELIRASGNIYTTSINLPALSYDTVAEYTAVIVYNTNFYTPADGDTWRVDLSQTEPATTVFTQPLGSYPYAGAADVLTTTVTRQIFIPAGVTTSIPFYTLAVNGTDAAGASILTTPTLPGHGLSDTASHKTLTIKRFKI